MWLSATFGMVAKELLVIKLNLILPTLANTWVGKEDIHSNLKPYLFRKMLKVVPKPWNPFKTHVDESKYKVELFAEFYLSFCLMVLTSGSGFFLAGKLEPNHHTRISEYIRDLLLLKSISTWCWWIYALLFFLGVGFSIS